MPCRLLKKFLNKSFILLLFIVFTFKINTLRSQCNMLCNTDFDDSLYTTSVSLFNENYIHCWNTTASDNKIEVWHSGFNGVPSYSGNQFIELNANLVSTLYQDFLIAAGSNITISFAHRGRAGIDVMDVSIGPVGGPYTNLGTFSDDNTAWGYYTLNYTIPTGLGNNYSLRFNSISAAGGNPAIGNFLDAITVTIPSNTTLTFSSSPVSCSGNNSGSAEVFVNGGISPYSYTWAPTGGNLANASNLTAGIYTVSVSEANGCIKSGTIQVSTSTTLSLTANSQDVSCIGLSDGSAQVIVNGGNPPFTYSWSPTSSSSQTITNLSSGTYTCIVTDNSGCSGTTTVNISAPSVSISATNSIITCAVNSISLTVNITPTGSYTYNWLPGSSTSSINIVTSTGVYTVNLLNTMNGCTTTAQYTITSDMNPPNIITSNTLIPCNSNTVTLFATSTNTNVSYLWTTNSGNSIIGSTSPNPIVNGVGQYTLTITNNNNGCVSSQVITVLKDTSIASTSIIANPTSGIAPLNVSFNIQNYSANNSYTWNFGDNTSSNISNPNHIYNTGTYTVTLTATDVSGLCSSTATVLVNVYDNNISILVPNVFTPNSDLTNDYFKIQTKGIKELHCEIYNRWGTKIATINDVNGFWDGGNHSDGTYFYILTAINIKDEKIEQHGFISLFH